MRNSQLLRTVTVLGSTGSIGTQTLDVVRSNPERFRVAGLSTRSNVSLLAGQVREFRPRIVGVETAAVAEALAEALADLPQLPEIVYGLEGYCRVATVPDACTAVVATVGSCGLRPAFAAIAAGKDVALANKEVLVMAGAIMTQAARVHGVTILPIDSEHSAIWQCLHSGSTAQVRRVVLTASGGPFRTRSRESLRCVTVNEALQHPTWEMGCKITIDSATLMNKGLEVIEAHHLFGLAAGQIDVVIHPQSIVHSLVEFVDGSVVAQLGYPDMRLPIQYALSHPERIPRAESPLDLAAVGSLTFEEPDLERFPCLRLGYEALRRGGTAPAALSVANEVAVRGFCDGAIGFMEIPATIERALAEHPFDPQPTLEDILQLETRVRVLVEEWLAARSH